MIIAALADLHLGRNPIDWGLAALERVRADVLVFAGDLVDRDHPEAAPLGEEFARACAELGISVVWVWGNHDRFRPEVPGIWYAPADRVATLDVAGVHFHAISVATDPDPRRVVAAFPRAQGVDVGVLHTSLTGQWSRKPCLPAEPQELTAKGYRAWVLGHVHRRVLLGNLVWPGMQRLIELEV